MTKTTARSEEPDSIHLASAAPSVLDGLPLDALFRAIVAEERGKGRLAPATLEKLDKVYQVKLCRLLGASHDIRSEAIRLDDHLGRVASDSASRSLNAAARPYAVRWQFVRELLSTALTMRSIQGEVAEAAPETLRKEAWELVAARVLRAPPEGVAWKVLAEELRKLPSVARSKASLSVLLSQLTTAGWVDARQVGREKYLRPGARISASAVYQEAVHARADDNGDSASARSLKLLRDYVCFSEGRLIENFHTMNSRHKEIRKALALRSSDKREAATRQAHDRFIRYLNEEFEFVAKSTFRRLATHFEHRGSSGHMVRICLKGNWTQDGAQVVDILRDGAVGYRGGPTDVHKNAGFHNVATTGTYFLGNNLPDMALKGEYWNPRLSPKKVAQVRSKLRHDQPSGDLRMNHEDWVGCWSDNATAIDSSSFYRSTLIIPCTVWNNSFSERFLTSIRSKVPDMTASFERIILGYLCLDHVETDFFQDPLDVDVGYVMADMLSIFLFMRWLLTKASDTYKEARKLVDSAPNVQDLEETLRLYEPEWRRIDQTPLTAHRSKDNYALETDRSLVDWLEKKQIIDVPEAV